MRKLILILALLLSPSLFAQGQKNYLTTRSFNRASLGSTLYKNLISFWKFDGNWNDSIGHNDLKPSGGPYVSATGVSGQAASFESDSSQYANITDNASLSVNSETNFTLSAWINVEALVGANIAMKGNNRFAIEYGLTHTDLAVISYIGNGSGQTSVNTTKPIIGSWVFVIMWYNTDTDSVYTRTNNGTITRSLAVYEPYDYTYQFKVGGVHNSTDYYDGLIDDVGFWKRCPTYTNGYAMADSIYNAGNGWRP